MVIYLQRLKEFLIWGEAFPDIGYRISRQLDCNGICISFYRIPTYNHTTVQNNLLELITVQFLKQNAFLTCSWRIFRSNKKEQLRFKLEKDGIQKSTGKYRKRKIDRFIFHCHEDENLKKIQKSKCNVTIFLFIQDFHLIFNNQRKPYILSKLTILW